MIIYLLFNEKIWISNNNHTKFSVSWKLNIFSNYLIIFQWYCLYLNLILLTIFKFIVLDEAASCTKLHVDSTSHHSTSAGILCRLASINAQTSILNVREATINWHSLLIHPHTRQIFISQNHSRWQAASCGSGLFLCCKQIWRNILPINWLAIEIRTECWQERWHYSDGESNSQRT